MKHAVLYGLTGLDFLLPTVFFYHFAFFLWPVKDEAALCFRKKTLQKNNTEVLQFQLCTLTDVFADSRDYELLVLTLSAFTNCSGKAFSY